MEELLSGLVTECERRVCNNVNKPAPGRVTAASAESFEEPAPAVAVTRRPVQVEPA